MKKYLLDTNVFIQAHRMHYPFDVVPGFWSKLVDLSNRDIIRSIDKVKKEICDSSRPDELAQWCLSNVNNLFFLDTPSCIDKYGDIAGWVLSHPQYNQAAKNDFLATDLADPWLIAYALKNDCIIVTHETSQPNAIKRIKIPEPCLHFGVKFMTPIQMFRDIRETF